MISASSLVSSDRPPVRGEHDVINFDASLVRRRIRHYIFDQYTGIARQAQSLREHRGQIRRVHADRSPPRAAILHQLFVNNTSRVTRDGKANALVAPGLRLNHGIDAHHISVHVDERSAGVARVDGRIGLQIHHGTVGVELLIDGTDHTQADAILQAQWTSKSQHQLARMDAVGVAKFQARACPVSLL